MAWVYGPVSCRKLYLDGMDCADAHRQEADKARPARLAMALRRFLNFGSAKTVDETISSPNLKGSRNVLRAERDSEISQDSALQMGRWWFIPVLRLMYGLPGFCMILLALLLRVGCRNCFSTPHAEGFVAATGKAVTRAGRRLLMWGLWWLKFVRVAEQIEAAVSKDDRSVLQVRRRRLRRRLAVNGEVHL